MSQYCSIWRFRIVWQVFNQHSFRETETQFLSLIFNDRAFDFSSSRHDIPMPNRNETFSGKINAYPVHLSKLLNERCPCLSSNKSADSINKHNVENMCQPGAPTEHWVEFLLSARNDKTSQDSHLLNADIYFIDSAVNDLNEGVARQKKTNYLNISPMDYIKRQNELLIHIISNFTTQPSIMYVGVSTRDYGQWYDSRIIRTTDSVYMHKELTSYYNIPHFSVVDGLGPFDTHESMDWFLNVF